MARICNAERVRFGVMSGHERKTLSLSGQQGHHVLDCISNRRAPLQAASKPRGSDGDEHSPPVLHVDELGYLSVWHVVHEHGVMPAIVEVGHGGELSMWATILVMQWLVGNCAFADGNAYMEPERKQKFVRYYGQIVIALSKMTKCHANHPPSFQTSKSYSLIWECG